MLKMAVNARYVRIKPQSWHNHIAMRVEVYKGEASECLHITLGACFQRKKSRVCVTLVSALRVK